MTAADRSTGNHRRIALGIAVGAGVTLLATVLARVAGRIANSLWPTPDANIGLGLVLLAAEVVAVPIGIWLGLRRLRVPAAGPVAAGTPVAYVVALFFVDPASAGSVGAQTLLVAAYTGAAVWLTGRLVTR
jgi:hypothetical protein